MPVLVYTENWDGKFKKLSFELISYANEIAKKVNALVASTKTKKSVFVTFITSYGLIINQYSKQYVQSELTINNLFI